MDAKIVEMLRGAKTEEEAMKILSDQRIELSDEELEELRGGTVYGIECATISSALATVVTCLID